MSNYLEKQGILSISPAYALSDQAVLSSNNSDTTAERADVGNPSDTEDKKEAPTDNDGSANSSAPVAPNIQINEQFEGTILNTQLWSIIERPKGYRNNEEQAYKASQVAVNNGTLVITAKKTSSGEWISGEVNSKWAYTYGDFEVRARLSASGPGVWPAAWLFNSDGIWPSGGELDIYESVDSYSSVYGTIHGGGTKETWQLQQGVHNIDPKVYHTYKISKRPGVISWWVDGIKRSEWRKESLSTGQEWPFEDYRYIGIMNVAIGGTWPSHSDQTTPREIHYMIDYFTVKNAR